ncbi:MAG: DUF4350 domain-containing protein, partial [Gammaproteobacteria bacterium]|nr:DUF4350 domain-containing protein [Gammaproteobacteria bacterium]
MRDRLVTAAGAIAACLLIYALFFNSGQQAPVTRPLSNEPGRNGYAALNDWLIGEGVPVVSWRERFTTLLDDTTLPETGNVMLMTLPFRLNAREVEQQQLLGWVGRGNTLLLAAALNDSPEWIDALDGLSFVSDLQTIGGIPFSVASETTESGFESQLATAFAPDEIIRFDPLEHPLMDGVAALQGYSDGISSAWSEDRDAFSITAPLLRLATESRYGVNAIFQRPLGAGHIIVVTSASMLTNHQIAESDAGRFVANVVRYHLNDGGAFVFDDMHQGLSSLYDDAAFYSERRLYLTIAFKNAARFAWLHGA